MYIQDMGEVGNMTDVKTLARYLLYLFKERMEGLQAEEFDVTPLKLQKLLYYCQGYALALTGRPVFADPIEAWKYGPVVGSVYQEYKCYGGCCIPLGSVTEVGEINENAASIARLVIEEKGRLSDLELANATHSEAPWRDAYKGTCGRGNETIPLEKIKTFFSEEMWKKETPGDEEDSFWMSTGEALTDADWEKVLAGV